MSYVLTMNLANNETAQFRERALRRVAELHDLDAVARELGLPPEQLFAWVQDAVKQGRRFGLRPSAPAIPARSLPIASAPQSIFAGFEVDLSKQSTRLLIAYIAVFSMYFVFMAFTTSLLGHIEESHAFRQVLVPTCIVLWLVLCVGMMLSLSKGFAADGIDLSIDNRVGMAIFFVGPFCSIAVCMLAGTLPIYLHRHSHQYLEAQTVVMDKRVSYSRGGYPSYEITTAVFDPRFPVQKFGVDRRQYDEVSVGEPVVVYGSVSWFGFKFEGHIFTPASP